MWCTAIKRRIWVQFYFVEVHGMSWVPKMFNKIILIACCFSRMTLKMAQITSSNYYQGIKCKNSKCYRFDRYSLFEKYINNLQPTLHVAKLFCRVDLLCKMSKNCWKNCLNIHKNKWCVFSIWYLMVILYFCIELFIFIESAQNSTNFIQSWFFGFLIKKEKISLS